MQTSKNTLVGFGRAPGPIALLSLCMVTAAWGAMLAPAWCGWWAIFGAFGFVAAIGLDVRNREQLRLIIQEHDRQVSQWIEGKLDKAVSGMRATDEIGTAVQQIVEGTGDAGSQCPPRREEPRVGLHCGITIAPVRELAAFPRGRSGESFPGDVRDISSRSVGLIHDRPIERGPVVLAFDLENGDRMHFLADVLWCEAQEDGRYISGGKLKRLLTSDEAVPSTAEVSTLEADPKMCA